MTQARPRSTFHGMRVLIAGANGHLGRQLVRAYAEAGFAVRALVRDPARLDRALSRFLEEVRPADVMKPQTLARICDDVDIVASAVGITRQRGRGLAQEVDLTGNIQLLHAAEAAGVGHFQKIAANFQPAVYFQADGVTPRYDVPLLSAALRFESFLREHATIPWTIIRSNGFFSDLKDVFDMACSGTVWSIGPAAARSNPIHEADVAEHFVHLAQTPRNGVEVIGGPDVLSIEEIARLAFDALANPRGKLRRVPDGLVAPVLGVLRHVSPATYSMLSFVRLNLLYDELIAPAVGTRRLRDSFAQLASARAASVALPARP